MRITTTYDSIEGSTELNIDDVDGMSFVLTFKEDESIEDVAKEFQIISDLMNNRIKHKTSGYIRAKYGDTPSYDQIGELIDGLNAIEKG